MQVSLNIYTPFGYFGFPPVALLNLIPNIPDVFLCVLSHMLSLRRSTHNPYILDAKSSHWYPNVSGGKETFIQVILEFSVTLCFHSYYISEGNVVFSCPHESNGYGYVTE